MPNDEEVNEQKKRPRGRPKKVKEEPKELVNEGREELRMTHEPQKPVTMNQVKESLTDLYKRAYGGGAGYAGRDWGIGWMDSLSSLNISNPFLQNQRLKMISTMPSEMETEDIMEALKAPQAHEQPLRGAGWNLSVTQYLYYQILRLACDVPVYNYYKLPQLLEEEKYSSKKFTEEDEYVDEWLTAFDVKNTLKRTALEVKREGKSTYLFRNSVYKDEKDGKRHVHYTTWQKMPSNYIKLTAIGEHGYIASFDMMLFMDPAFNVLQYPPFIRDIWEQLTGAENIIHINPYGKYSVDVNKLLKFQYKDASGKLVNGIFESQPDRYLFWVQLPQDVCFTFSSDSSHPWAVPDTIGLFSNLQELSDYSTLAGLVASTPLTAILTGEMETVNEPNPGRDQTIINPETAVGIQNEFNSKTSTNVEALFVPFKNLKLQSLPNQPNSSDIVTKAVQNFISQAGEGGILVATEKPSVAQVKGAQLLEASKQDFVTRQFETILNMLINKHLGCEFKWKIFLWGDIYSLSEEVKRDKEMWQAGATFLLPKIASAYGMNVRDTKAAELYVKSMGVYSEMKTLTQETQMKQQEEMAEKNAKLAQENAKANAKLANQNKTVSAMGSKTSSSTNTTNTDLKTAEKKSVGRPAKSDSEVDNDNTAASKDSGRNTGEGRMYSSERHCIVCGSDDLEDGEFMCESCKEQYLEEGGEI